MGAVYLGHDRMLDRPVALKFIAAVDPDPRARERFLEEARAIARLHHPNVAGIYRIGTVDDRPYLAYELVDGEPLHRVPRPMPWRRALELGVGMARGLAAVHASGVLHRDIKPSNVVIGRSEVPKLIDFGLARRLDALSTPPSAVVAPDVLSAMSTALGLTSVGKIAGTPLYMAPELWIGTAPSPESDVYALGLVLWEILAGDLPFAALAGERLVGAILGQPLPPILELRPDLPAGLAALIDRCTARAPVDRPSAATLRDQLETIRAVYAPLVAAVEDLGERAAADALSASFSRATASPDRFASRFYDHAFTTAPALRALFPADMSALRMKVVSTLHTVVRNARSPELVVPLLEDLGERHHRYGVEHAHFEVMGQALLAALAELDRDAWTPELEALWIRAYQHIAEHMSRGLARAARGSSPRHVPPPLSRRRVDPPAIRYARSDSAVIAYQVFGEGPRDLVVMPGWVSNVELAWQEPGYADLLNRLACRARVILFDRRGTGLSDRTPDGLGLDHRLADLLAVLDATGAERPALFAMSDSAAVAAMFAATHPERVRGLVLYGGNPCMLARPDFPDALPPEALEAACTAILAHWGEPLFLEQEAPSRADDEAFRAWWARYLRASATPTVAISMLRGSASLDLRAALPAVRTPTLVLHRRGDRMMPVAAGRALARGIPGARMIELDGDDHIPFAGDREPLVAAIEDFLADMPTVIDGPVRLATALAIRPRSEVHGAWRRVVEREHGTVVTDEVALFDVPGAALRTARALRDLLAAAAVHAEVGPGRDQTADDAAATLARTLAAAAPDGELWVTRTAADLAGDELGPAEPRPGDHLAVRL